MRHIAFCLPLLIALAACQADTGTPANPGTDRDVPANAQPPATEPQQPGAGEASALEESNPATDECGSDKLGRWLNVLPTDTVKAEIAEAVGHGRIRYIAPGDAVTLDLRPDRLNVETGEDGRIKLFRCG